MRQIAMAEKPKEDRSGQESPSTDGEATGNPDAEEIQEMLFNAQVELNLLREALMAVQLEQVRHRAVQKQMTNVQDLLCSGATKPRIDKKGRNTTSLQTGPFRGWALLPPGNAPSDYALTSRNEG